MATTVIDAREARPAHFWASTNGKKVVMGVTGCILFLYVTVHMLGNLQVFEGPEKLNAYGRLLHASAELLWGARIILLASVILHITASVQLAVRINAARPVSYAKKHNIASDYASRTMN